MKFLLISIILHLVLIFKFFHYESIHPKSNEEKVISISINNFPDKLDSKNKEAISHKNRENKHFFNENANKILKKKDYLHENALEKKTIGTKNDDSIAKIENKQVEMEQKDAEVEEKTIKMEQTSYITTNFNKEVATEQIASIYSNSEGSYVVKSNSNAIVVNSFSNGNTDGVSGEGNLSSGEAVIAKNQDIEGLKYNIISSSDPEYPIVAKKANYKNTVVIKVRFLVNVEGKIEEIKFYDNETKFGFHEEVENSLKKWKFSPPKLNGKSVKMYFYKSFVFKLN